MSRFDPKPVTLEMGAVRAVLEKRLAVAGWENGGPEGPQLEGRIRALRKIPFEW